MDPREITTIVPRGFIRIYQALRAGGVPHCRFAPSCSAYAADALKAKGLVMGLKLTILRISKCHPWHPGGYDPVSF